MLSVFGSATSTGLSCFLDGSVSHDKFTRILSENQFGSRYLWIDVKEMVRNHESEDASLILYDTIISKPCMDENDLISWHFGHSKNRDEKWINLLTAFYHIISPKWEQTLRVPVSFECIKKTVRLCDISTRREKRQSSVSKNELMREMITQSINGQHLVFKYVLADSRFASADNMRFIHGLDKFFLMDVKSNRLCMSAEKNRNKAGWTSLDKLPLNPGNPVKVWLKDLEIPVLLCTSLQKMMVQRVKCTW